MNSTLQFWLYQTSVLLLMVQSVLSGGGRTGAVVGPPPTSQTWFVNSGGGNRFSVNATAGECDGKSAASYASTGGTGVNQRCAFNDIRYLWTDGTFTTNVGAGAPKWGWIGSGGDTYLIDTCVQYSSPGVPIPGSSGTCRIGQYGPNSGDSFGLNGDPFSSGPPTIPAGTAGNHTKIYGINHSSCGSTSSYTNIIGGFGVSWIFNVGHTNYVDLECIDAADGSICSKASSLTTNPCNTSFPLSDYATTGINFYWDATNINITNVRLHGTAASCFFGPTGDNTNITNVILSGCPHSNWDLDPGDGTTGTGTLTLTNVWNYFSGFEEVWPIVPANNMTMDAGVVIGQVGDGTDQLSGGYGDGYGTTTVQSSPAWHIILVNATTAYATQDGDDWLHVTGGGSRADVFNSLSYSNMGQQVKTGAAGSIINTIMIGNCNGNRFVTGLAPGGAAQLSLWCRAGDAAVLITVNNGETTNIQFNTMVTASVIAYEVQTEANCNNSTCVLNFQNNVLSGFLNSTGNGYTSAQATGKLPNPIFFDLANPFTVGSASVYGNNNTWNQLLSAPCPATFVGEINAQCGNSNLVNMSWPLFGIPSGTVAGVGPTGSPLTGNGITISGIPRDYLNNLRGTPPTIGAIE